MVAPIAVLVAAISVLSPRPCVAGEKPVYPVKPIRLIVPFPAGDSADVIARLLAGPLAAHLQQAVMIDNRSGKSGIRGTEIAARSKPDGYTISMGTTVTHVIAPLAMRPWYNSVQDFDPVTLVAVMPYVLTVGADVKADSLRALVSLAKSQSRTPRYPLGADPMSYVAMALLERAANVQIARARPSTAGALNNALLNGRVQVLFGSMSTVRPYVQSGALRAIAVGTAKRTVVLPEVPTVAESGYSGFEAMQWFAFFVPRGTSAAVIHKLHVGLAGIAVTPEVKNQLERTGAEVLTSVSNVQLVKRIRAEARRFSSAVKSADISIMR
jgi:tripartite-type tricarboxylate transporter receptor subunit TctC